ncbi:MAG: RNA polymerase sporulation sigma factor SigK [Oscillospiraceae bacterium]|nr:RNA polymerase sporulation sigma factor SigK [Oscillospiraceae bacterium]
MSILWLALGGMIPLRLSTGSFPKPLTSEEENHYLNLATQGDQDARNVLIERNLRLVAHIMKKYYASESDQDDLISIGTIGLIKAVSTYRMDKNIRLATYASRCIENEILMHFRSRKKSSQDVSLSDYIESGTDGNALSLMDVIREDDDLLDRIMVKEDVRRVRSAVQDCLSDQERQVICLRYGLEGRTAQRQREVAQAIGISRSYVSHPGYCKR